MAPSLPFTPTRPAPASPTSTPITLTFPTHSGSQAGLIAQVTFCSPHNLNALRSDDIQLFIAVLEWINEQPPILITILTGSGRFFSAGANISDPARTLPTEITDLPEDDPVHISVKRQYFAQRAYTNNSRFAHTLYHHDKLLVCAMNGPVVGITAAGIAYADFIYCFDDFWLATPFTSLALVAEGGASTTFVKKMGLGKAQQALMEGRRMHAKELLEAGFVSTVFPTPSMPSGADKKTYTPPIMDVVLPHITSKFLPPTADPFALLYTKSLIKEATYENKSWSQVNYAEVQGAQTVFASGRPMKQFQRLASGGRHKL